MAEALHTITQSFNSGKAKNTFAVSIDRSDGATLAAIKALLPDGYEVFKADKKSSGKTVKALSAVNGTNKMVVSVNRKLAKTSGKYQGSTLYLRFVPDSKTEDDVKTGLATAKFSTNVGKSGGTSTAADIKHSFSAVIKDS